MVELVATKILVLLTFSIGLLMMHISHTEIQILIIFRSNPNPNFIFIFFPLRKRRKTHTKWLSEKKKVLTSINRAILKLEEDRDKIDAEIHRLKQKAEMYANLNARRAHAHGRSSGMPNVANFVNSLPNDPYFGHRYRYWKHARTQHMAELGRVETKRMLNHLRFAEMARGNKNGRKTNHTNRGTSKRI
jgi:hypothetical protein